MSLRKRSLELLVVIVVAACTDSPTRHALSPTRVADVSGSGIQVAVDPGAYTGSWRVKDVTGFATGAQTVSLPAGTYAFQVGADDNGYFNVTVGPDGTVTSGNAAAAVGGAGTLLFHTVAITIDPGAYTGQWILRNVETQYASGKRTAILLPGVGFDVNVGASDLGVLLFRVGADGSVASLNSDAATGTGNTLGFITRVISVDPGGYAGRWQFRGIDATPTAGARSMTVVQGLGYAINVASNDLAFLFFDVGADGTITSRNTAAANGGNSKLTFNTTGISVDPGTFSGTWRLLSLEDNYAAGARSFTVVPNLGYAINVGANDLGVFFFDVSATGAVTPHNTPAALGSGSVLTMRSAQVSVVPSAPGPWGINAVVSASGPVTLNLVSGIGYALYSGSAAANFQFFHLGDPCAFSPASLTFGSVTYSFRCGGLNRPPTANPGGPYRGVEGGAVQLDGSASSDPDGDALTYQWSFGDGSSASGQIASHSYVDNGTFTATLIVTDPAGAASTASSQVVIDNVAPTTSAITAPVDPVQVNTMVSASVGFSDPGILDTHTAVFDWNADGVSSTTAGIVTESNGSGSAAASYTYTTPGVYSLRATVTDKDGASGSSTFQYVVVYDPNGGFVTGGGWINSPSGACQLTSVCAGAVGKATFGFVAKYQPGATVPTGNTQFTFQAGGLQFSSSSYDWLVVSGSRAQYKGTGSINGVSGYRFILTAIDGQASGGGGVDRFRMKIWNDATGGIVYDNQMGAADGADPTTVLGGGSITIHS